MISDDALENLTGFFEIAGGKKIPALLVLEPGQPVTAVRKGFLEPARGFFCLLYAFETEQAEDFAPGNRRVPRVRRDTYKSRERVLVVLGFKQEGGEGLARIRFERAFGILFGERLEGRDGFGLPIEVRQEPRPVVCEAIGIRGVGKSPQQGLAGLNGFHCLPVCLVGPRQAAQYGAVWPEGQQSRVDIDGATVVACPEGALGQQRARGARQCGRRGPQEKLGQVVRRALREPALQEDAAELVPGVALQVAPWKFEEEIAQRFLGRNVVFLQGLAQADAVGGPFRGRALRIRFPDASVGRHGGVDPRGFEPA